MHNKLKMVYEIDDNGKFIKDVILERENEEQEFVIPVNCVEEKPPQYYIKIWKNGEWIEGKPLEEIEEEKLNASLLPKEEEAKKAELKLEILNTIIEMEII